MWWIITLIAFFYLISSLRKTYHIEKIAEEMVGEVEEWRSQIPVNKPTFTELLIIQKHAKRLEKWF